MFSHVIVDNWYENPDEIRTSVLERFKTDESSGKEKIKDNGYAPYPGYRCKSTIKNLIENKIKLEKKSNFEIDSKRWIFAQTCDIDCDLDMLQFDMNTMSMKIIDSDIILNLSESLSNGCFQYCDENSEMWIHSDPGNTYAAVVYLTPKPPEGSGTGFFRNKVTGQEIPSNPEEVLPKEESMNLDSWELTDYVENVYNRCVIFNAKRFHSATKYFGTTPENSRLFQVFFFDRK